MRVILKIQPHLLIKYALLLALAAAIRLGEASVASEYLQVLRGLEKTLQADPKLKSSLRWCSQARDLWTDWRQGQ